MAVHSNTPDFPSSVMADAQLAAAWRTNVQDQQGEMELRRSYGETSVDDGFFEITESIVNSFGVKTVTRVVRVPIFDIPLTPEQALDLYTPIRQSVQAKSAAGEDYAFERQQLTQLANFMLAFIAAAAEPYLGAGGAFRDKLPLGIYVALQGWSAWAASHNEYMAARDTGANPHVVRMLFDRSEGIHDELLADTEYAIRELTGTLANAA